MRIRNRLAALGVSTTLALGVSAAVGHAVTDPLPNRTEHAVRRRGQRRRARCRHPGRLPRPGHGRRTRPPRLRPVPRGRHRPHLDDLLRFTGSAATSIDAFILTPTGAVSGPVVVFKDFYVKESIPTTIELPCSGTGEVTFVPRTDQPDRPQRLRVGNLQNIAV